VHFVCSEAYPSHLKIPAFTTTTRPVTWPHIPENLNLHTEEFLNIRMKTTH